MKLAYIITSHFDLKQTLRLFNRLNHKDSFFVFHVSRKCEPQYYEMLYAALKENENCFFAKRINVIYTQFSYVQAVLNGIDTLIENNIGFDYVFLLSGQDYPIKPRNVVIETLRRNQGKQYLEIIPFKELSHIRDWLEDYHFWVGKRRFWHPHHRTDNKIITAYNFILSLILPKNRKLPEGFIPYKGSTWWTLTQDCVEYLHNHAHSLEGKKIIRYFKNVWHSPELYFQSVLMNSKFRDRIINNDLRFILWPENDIGHPQILTETNYSEIVSSDRLIARKFDVRVDAQILNLIDEKILNESLQSTDLSV